MGTFPFSIYMWLHLFPNMCGCVYQIPLDISIKIKASDTLTTFVQFKALVELQFSLKIKSIQIDGGGEFRPFTYFLNSHDIIHRITCPHTHH